MKTALYLPMATPSQEPSGLDRLGSSPSAPRTHLRLFWLVVALGCLPLVLTGCFQASNDTRALRAVLLENAEAQPDTQISFAVGSVALGLTRCGSWFVDLPPEARAGLAAARSAEVSVSEFGGRRGPGNPRNVLAKADRLMTEKGWEKMVTVLDRREAVLLYAKPAGLFEDQLRVTVVVMNEKELILVAAQAKLDPLLKLVEAQLAKERGVLQVSLAR